MKIVESNGKVLAHVTRDEWLKMGSVAGWADEYGLGKEAASRGSEIDEAQKLISGIADIEKRLNNTVKALQSMSRKIENPVLQKSHQEVLQWIGEAKKHMGTLRSSFLPPKPVETLKPAGLPTSKTKESPKKHSIERGRLEGLEMAASGNATMKKEALSLFRKTQGNLFDAVMKEVVTINKLINSYFQKATALSEKTRIPNLKRQMADFAESLKKVKIPAMEALEALGEEDDMFEWETKKEENKEPATATTSPEVAAKPAETVAPAPAPETATKPVETPDPAPAAETTAKPAAPVAGVSVAPETAEKLKNAALNAVNEFAKNLTDEKAKKMVQLIRELSPESAAI